MIGEHDMILGKTASMGRLSPGVSMNDYHFGSNRSTRVHRMTRNYVSCGRFLKILVVVGNSTQFSFRRE